MEIEPIKCPYASHITKLCQKTFQSHEEAAKHLILEHNARPILLNGDGKYICYYGKDFGRSGCQETFPTQKKAREHLEQDHQNETDPIQCPVSSECKSNCYTADGLKHHVDNSHRVTTFRCTWKDCLKTCKTRGGLISHVDSKHKGKTWDCPVEGCTKTYKEESGRRGHMKKKHPNWRDPSKLQPSKPRRRKAKVAQASAKSVELDCPFSYCNDKSHTRDALKWHVYQKKHKGEPIPCQVEGCGQSFLDLRKWELHVKDHKNPPVESHACRYETCPKTFKTEEQADEHYQTQHIDPGHGRTCPTCNETFSSNDARRYHELRIHARTFCCSRLHCNQRFETCEMAIEHSLGIDHDFVGKLYTCPVPHCAVTAAGRGLIGNKLENHFGRHVRLDNVPEGIELVRILAPAPQPLPRLPLFEAIYRHNAYLSMQQKTSPGQDEEKVSKTEDLGHAVDDVMGVDYEALEQYNLDLPDDMPLEEDNLGPAEGDDEELFSERHRSYIMEQNAEFWENHKDQPINLHGRGRICCGPGLGTGDFVLEPCPGRVVIDLDTARLRLVGLKNGKQTITLNYACVSCFTLKRARAFLEQGKAKSDGSLENVDLTVLRHLFADAAKKKWTCPPEFQRVLERVKDIEEGSMPPSSLLILDTEFSVATRQPWEVTIIEYLSAKTRLNALLDHADGLSHESQERRIRQISKMHAKNVYNPKRNLDKLNVHQVAKASDCQQARDMCLSVPELCKPVKERKIQWRPEHIKKPSAGSLHDYFSTTNEKQRSDDAPGKSEEKSKSTRKPLKPPMRQSKLCFAGQVQSESQEAAPTSDITKPLRSSKRLQSTHK
ncbi:hypothetical protein H9Q74_010241 [Fusarium xylarioides]|nr:hypothetical protein H9Q71_010379 [Fusarium xylarioides]KAG5818062.1 hypothetical protein H9Q74_010241 [Fusarium xylarioides]